MCIRDRSISARRGPQRELEIRWQHWCMHPWCRNVEIFENIDADDGFGHLNQPKSFAGVIFNALRRANVLLHVTPKVVAPKSNTGTRRIARRKALASMLAFRYSPASGSRTSALNEKSLRIKQLQCVMAWSSPSISVRRGLQPEL